MTEFATKLRKLRGEKNSKAVAELIGISRMTLKRYENGEREPTWGNVLAICEYYGVSPSYFMQGGAKPMGFDPQKTVKPDRKEVVQTWETT